ncbi:MAG: flagellar motor switch protein FliM [Nitrospirae bacterium]|nr:flagellar motor switch protein FliM [Nitrospirota bacterium]
MNKILSQDEVDALLKGVSSGDIDTEAKKESPGGVKQYDFTNQERIIRGRMPGLEIANERFARFFRNSISSVLMKAVDVSIRNVEMMKFGEFMKIIPFPSSINIFKMEPLKGYALFVIDAQMVFAFVDYFFGGGAGSPYVKSEGRYFTPIEQKIIRRIVGIALDDMATAWKALAAIEPEYISSEMNPQFVTIVTPAEIILKIEIALEVENFTGRLFFCIPYSMIEPVKEKLYSGIQVDKLDIDERWISRIKEILTDSYVEVVTEMGCAELTLEDLTKLEVGNVITIGKKVSDDILVKVEGVPKLTGSHGLSIGNYAVKIKGFIEKGEHHD